jgi:hypothetical protein
VKPGLVGTVLVVLAGGAVGGAVVLRDQTKAKRATQEVKKAEDLLGEGDLDGAQAAFLSANRAAAQVGGLGGKREQALSVSGRARRGLRVVGALKAVQTTPRAALHALTTLEPTPDQAEGLSGRIEAEELLGAALLLEQAKSDEAARKVFGAAVTALAATDSSRGPEAKLGLRRLTLLRSVRDAEDAIANRKVARALELCKDALAKLGEAESPFSDEGQVEALQTRLRSIQAQAESGRRIEEHDAKVIALAGRVNGPDLGKLASEVEALSPPTLPTGHAREADDKKRLAAIEERRAGILRVAKDFAGMVWLKKTDTGSLFMDPTEVTVGAYRPFLKQGYKHDVDLWGEEGLGRLKAGEFLTRDGKPGPVTWLGGKQPTKQTFRHPVSGISYFEAAAFARWAKKRLPTVEEFRLAGAGQPYPWGSKYVTGRANLKDAKGAVSYPVGTYKTKGGSTETGIHDLVGNVREYVRDEAGKYHVIGGSFRKYPKYSRLDTLGSCTPFSRGDDMGFRCVKELEWTE